MRTEDLEPMERSFQGRTCRGKGGVEGGVGLLLGSLIQLLDQLDSYALQTQRAITIPLIKAMLENE